MSDDANRAARLLTLRVLARVRDGAPRYAEAMEAWRSTCPRLSVWEDALAEGLVALDTRGAACMAESRVALMPRGEALLAGAMAGRPVVPAAPPCAA